MESDGFRRGFLRWVASAGDLDWMPGESSFAAARERRLEKLGDVVAENVDREGLLRLIDDGPPSGLPVVSGQQTAVSDGSSPQTLPTANGEISVLVPRTFAAPGSDEQGEKADG